MCVCVCHTAHLSHISPESCTLRAAFSVRSFRLTETGRGLACDSESSFEATHIDFSNVWSRYLVRDRTSPRYKPQLLSAVLSFNASHVPHAVIGAHIDEGRGAAGSLEQSDQSGIQEGPAGQVRQFLEICVM